MKNAYWLIRDLKLFPHKVHSSTVLYLISWAYDIISPLDLNISRELEPNLYGQETCTVEDIQYLKNLITKFFLPWNEGPLLLHTDVRGQRFWHHKVDPGSLSAPPAVPSWNRPSPVEDADQSPVTGTHSAEIKNMMCFTFCLVYNQRQKLPQYPGRNFS